MFNKDDTFKKDINIKSDHKTPLKKPPVNTLSVVGIGASAGGLEALKDLFSNLSPSSGFAFIVVTHQQPDHISLLPELLSHYTDMPVTSVTEGELLQPDHVFVCPAGKNLVLRHHKLHLVDPVKHNANNLPIDYFFRSLAADIKDLSIGIILSGTGTDGTLGLNAIKGVNGLTIVQSPESSKFDGMPNSAIAMGNIDFVLPVENIGQQLIHYRDGPYFISPTVIKQEALIAAEPMQKILVLLKNRCGNDLSGYKTSTIERRTARRMNIFQIKNANDYVQFLLENPVEIDRLFKELLINVTNFFRDAEAFKVLSEKCLPKLFAGKPDYYTLRVWVPGCSSGEEPYSLAILIRETIEKLGKPYDFQIFATDLDPSSINRARDGSYPAGIAADVSPERLERFFRFDENYYRINKDIRDRIIFATQNLIQDPLFTHLDLISCRNLLIYLSSDLQKELLPRFQYALNPGGMLFLGSSEGIGSFEDLFSVIDKRWKIYQRKNGQLSFPFSKRNLLSVADNKSVSTGAKPANSQYQTINIVQRIEHLLLERFVPVSVIIDEHGKIIYVHGRTGNYLELTPGQPNWNLFDMTREGLRMPLVMSVNKAIKTNDQEIINKGLTIKNNGNFETIDLTVIKIVEPEPLKDLYLVSFQPQSKQEAPSSLTVPTQIAINRFDKTAETEQLQQELHLTKESLNATIEELQTSNEEIKSTNEELQATNEELQSSNEELESSKEEMQSLNEELNTVNSELQFKIDALSEINNDMQNLMNSTDIATIFLDTQLKIKRFTVQAQKIINLIDSDLGRPLADLASNLKYGALISDAQKVLKTLVYEDTEVQSIHGNWYLLRILPYRTAENIVDGLVITFIDITRLKKAEQIAQSAELTSAIVNTINQPLLVLDENLQIFTSNDYYNQFFNINPELLNGHSLFTIHDGVWNSPQLQKLLKTTLEHQIPFDKFIYEAEFSDIGHKSLIINGRVLKQLPHSPMLILLAIDESREREWKIPPAI